MKRILILLTVMAGVVLSAAPAAAQLERVGPTVSAHGYPAWYQDKTGIALEFCQPLNQAELDGGWCLLLPGDTTVPEAFPTRFAEEHFYFAADSSFTAGGVNALLVIGLEAAFAAGPPVPGEQVVFARVRIRIDGLANGTYTVRHPFGTNVFDVTGGGINFTEDIGIQCLPGQFDCALQGRIGPFLLPRDPITGGEMAPVSGPVPGKLYIARPDLTYAVIGSPVGQNFFRVEGPGGALIGGTDQFSLMGRLFTGAISGKMTVDRASYASDASGNKLDVFATAFPTTQTRLPGGGAPPVIQPVLAFYPAACVPNSTGVLGPPPIPGVQMLNDGSNYHGQVLPAAVPPAVCVGDLTARDGAGQAVPLFSEKLVTDQVTVTQALFNNGTLTVSASSSDAVTPPTLEALGYGVLPVSGMQAFLVVAPPSRVRVSSTRGAVAELLVTTGVGTSPPIDIPIAVNDSYTVAEDSAATLFDVLANDTYSGTPTVTLVAPAALGSAIVSGTQIAYVPSPNASGADALAYTVTVNGRTSPAAFVSIQITPVNDLPVAVNDSRAGVVNAPIAINVLANDTDVDGAADLAGAQLVSQSAGLTLISNVGGVITVQAGFPGTYTLSYRAVDSTGAASLLAATVTVNVTGNERITILRAEFVRNKARWRVEGTTDLIAGQTISIAYDNGALTTSTSPVSLAGFVIGTAVVDATGAWVMDIVVPNVAPLDPSAAGYSIRPSRVRATSPLGGFATAVFSIR